MLICCQAFAQVKGDFLYIRGNDTTHVPFLYLGRDTLDYADGGCEKTQAKIVSVSLDSAKLNYVVEGVLTDLITGEDFANNGLALLGRIRLIKARTWVGEGTTGFLVRESPVVQTNGGRFRITAPRKYNGYLIVTGLGATVIDMPFQNLVKKHSSR